MRDRLLDELAPVPRHEFLVYVMGPYKSTGPDENEALFDLLVTVRDRLRTESGVNAFLAVDPEIPLEEVDAATQSIAFARASNAVVFVLPFDGDNLGVGVEVGSVLEDIYQSDDTNRAERIVLIHEEGVRSAMLGGVTRRWDATVYAYADADELLLRAKEFVGNVVSRESTGDLPRLE
ncbi:DUF7509 family protein [Natrononativus amylolyticus]|uniref:DUF7509 family protein n=1 Tax=Natrononativus amylolyticus TaxID=2963434 RepID=UPI0020CF242D|nr:hypothetical protein [Natrononativus amylolyticus]